MSVFSITGRHHTVLRVPVDGRSLSLPLGWTVRLLVLCDAQDRSGPYWPLYDYMINRWNKSDAWQEEIARSVGVFWDFVVAKRSLELKSLKPSDKTRIFADFSRALINGTCNGVQDPLGLYWKQQPVDQARRILGAVDQFISSMVQDVEKPKDVDVVNHELSTIFHWARKNNVSLRSSMHGGERPLSTTVVSNIPRGRTASPAISFPAQFVETVLWDGFRRGGPEKGGWGDYNIGAMMIFLLQAYGGAREHEPHHLWETDVVEDPSRPGHASVALYHPSFGVAFQDDVDGKPQRTQRHNVLKERYGLPPRNLGTGSYRIGWKNAKVATKDHFALFFWSDPMASMLFFELYRHYLGYRAQLMERRASLGLPPHPFLFVSSREARNRADGYRWIGAPASIESYETHLERAVKRVGLSYGHEFGTTSHGLRHLYAYTLRKLGIKNKLLQEGLRHRHPTSSSRYGLPPALEISAELTAAWAKNRDSLPEGIRLTRTQRYFQASGQGYEGDLF